MHGLLLCRGWWTFDSTVSQSVLNRRTGAGRMHLEPAEWQTAHWHALAAWRVKELLACQTASAGISGSLPPCIHYRLLVRRRVLRLNPAHERGNEWGAGCMTPGTLSWSARFRGARLHR